jgi:purine-binding chemotaxis protein CheW
MEKQLVVFELANENFVVDISAVESIIKLQAITVVPQAPEFVKGVINLRGKVLPVIDLCKRFGLPASEYTKASRIVVVSMEGKEVGMVVDGVSEVITTTDEAIEPVPAMVSTVDSTFLVGIAKIDGRLVILLDLGKVLSADERAAFAMA